MSSPQTPSQPSEFDHRMAVFGSDEEWTAAALPFLEEGLAAPEEPPPTVIAAPAKLDLLRDALGADAKGMTFIPHTEWYAGSAANAVSQSAGYLAAHAGPGGRVHLLMEPDWSGRAGRSARETAEWIRYESLANLLFAPFRTTALCAYDTRTAGPAIVDAARRAHPGTPVYETPARLVGELDALPLPPPPPGADFLETPDPEAVRAWAVARGLAPAEAGLFAAAVAEATPGPLADGALLWGEAPGCVCELRTGARVDDPLAGFVPPATAELEPGQGLWFTRQVCAYVDIRDRGEGSVIRIQYA